VPASAGAAVLSAARPAVPAAAAAAAVVVVAPGRSAAVLRDGVYVVGVAGRSSCAAAAEVAQGVVPTAADGGDADPGG
jgi:hypothetical protein